MVTSWVGLMVFSLGLVASMLPLLPFVKSEKPPTVVMVFAIFLMAVFQIYFWGLWSAYCVALVMKYTQMEGVTMNWLYWVCGFLWCTALIGWLSSKEQHGQSFEKTKDIQKGTAFYKLTAIVGYLIFAFSPNLAFYPYGWFMKITGLSKYIFDAI